MEVLKNIPNAPAAAGAYSAAVMSKGMLYCAGQVALDPTSNTMIEGDIQAQATQVFDNISAVLKAGGCDWNCIVMATIFLSDMADFKVVNELYSSYVSSSSPPARQTVAVKELPLQALVEISVIAEIPE